MDLEDVVLVGSVREMVRNHTPTMKLAAIRDCIEARRNGESWEQPVSTPEPRGPPGSVPPPCAPASVLGWGAATGNNGRSGSMWMASVGGKSGNASTGDLLDGTRNTDPLAQNFAEYGDPLAAEYGDPLAAEYGDPLYIRLDEQPPF